MRTASFKAPLLFALLLAGASFAEGRDSPRSVFGGPLGHRLDEAIQRATNGAFWGAVLVAREGEILLAKGYGYADYADRPATPETLYEIASISKPFTATLVLRLAEKGTLGLDDTLDRFFEDVPEDKRAVTVRHLLTHTSGLSNRLGVPYASPIGREDYVRQMLAPPLEAEPGTRFAYNNAGYALLAAVVEKATGRSFEEAMHEEVFGPAKMKDTGLVGDPKLVRSPDVSARVQDGTRDGTAADWHWGWGYRGMGGVVTTVLDLFRFDRALWGDDFLEEETKATMYEPALEGYACGWRVDTTDRGTRKIHHSGGVRGYAAQLARYVDEDVLVVVLTNPKNPLGLVEKTITDLLFPPVRIVAEIDVSAYALTEFLAAPMEEGLSWDVGEEEGAVVLRLRHEDRVPAVMRLPASYAAKLKQDLDRAIAAQARSSADEPPAMDGGVYLAAYGPASKTLRLEEELRIDILPRYVGRGQDGERIVDERPVFVLVDARRRMWPVMVKMNVAAARALREALP